MSRADLHLAAMIVIIYVKWMPGSIKFHNKIY
jgi:hypothetical protein